MQDQLQADASHERAASEKNNGDALIPGQPDTIQLCQVAGVENRDRGGAMEESELNLNR